MKLVAPARSTSFYESFSDLIFCTLCLFLLIVVALAVQVREASEELRAQAKEVVVPNKFVGAPAKTTMYSTLIRIKGKPHMVIGRGDHSVQLGLVTRTEEDEAEVVRFLRATTKNAASPVHQESYFILPAEDLKKLAPGLSLGDVQNNINLPLFNWLAQGYFHLLENHTAMIAETASDLEIRQSIYDRFTDSAAERDFKNWRTGYGAGNQGHQWGQVVLASFQHQAVPPFLRFSIVPDDSLAGSEPEEWRKKARVKVGYLEMTVPEFKALVEAIKPGFGFSLEYVDENRKGERVPAPEIVKTEILKPLWFTGRVLSEAGKESVDESEKDETNER